MVSQIAVFMENRKGRLVNLTKILKQNNIDLVTLSIADTKDYGILRLIARDNVKAEKILKDAGFTITTTNLIGIKVEDRPGSMSDILEILDDNDINVDYLYSFAHKNTELATVVLKVSDEKKALELFKNKNIALLDQNMI